MDQWIDPEQAAVEATRSGGIGKRVAVVASSLVLALGAGGAVVGCGDDDNEGPAEEAGQAVDDAGSEAEDAIEDADKEVGDDKD
jgi:hypothetical protein